MGLSHVDEKGAAHMVDVGDKPPTKRIARAQAKVSLSAATLDMISQGGLPKGDALAVARVAGIMAAKRTPDLIPLCHPLALDAVSIEFDLSGPQVVIEATASTRGPTGVEMEALTAAAVAALTLYDMIKAVERSAAIESVELLEKSGGKSGHYQRS